MKKHEIMERFKLGGPGSGHYGHAGGPGGPGRPGGSAPRSAGMSLKTGPTWEKRWHEARGDKFGYSTAPESAGMGGSAAGRFITRKEDTESSWARSKAKDEIVTTLSNATGLPYEDVNTVIHQWAQSANDSDYRSLSMQEAISKEFGVPLSKFQQDSIAQYGKAWKDPEGKDALQRYINAEENFRKTPFISAYSPDYQGSPRQLYSMQMETIKKELQDKGFGDKWGGIQPSKHQPLLSNRADPEGDVRKVVRAMYVHTQSELAKAGVTELKLARGSNSSPIDPKTGQFYIAHKWVPGVGYRKNVNTEVILNTNSASSWSSRKSTAAKFGSVVVATFPASRILGCARTGFGCLNEQEFVVLGSTNDRGTWVGE